MSFFPWRVPPDPLLKRTERGGAILAERAVARWDDVIHQVPSVAAAPLSEWRQVVMVASALLTIFPLLRACGGDAARFRRLRAKLLDSLDLAVPGSTPLVVEAERATVPPSGHEQTRTLHEVDETTSLALAGWAVRRLGGPDAAARSWEDVRRVAAILRELATGFWAQPES